MPCFRQHLRRASKVALVALSASLLTDAMTARAAWPPPLEATRAEMKNPANWPNDPDYAYVASAKPSERQSGQWQFYSFLPDRSPNAGPVRPGETASGMSVDLAWRHTIGDDRVLIAVLDSGIRWDERDLIEKAYLNRGELEKYAPTRRDGSACAPLDPAEPSRNLFDCNGDGIFTVSDYAEDPRLESGDVNGNGVLDAGDLILTFSDGVDDDGNGYVDDISGWDFMKDDNDPYDDTRYGHGTGEARDSTAATNNGIGGAGVCPLCRFVALRVGDSFIADVQAFSKAVVYAADNGASVIQEALGTINMSSFAQAALDYAWAKGVVVVASMADENSRHHNMPTANNHTMPVHAVTMSGTNASSTTAESFLAFNTCTNYGAQNLLSASGTGCSSEATGRLSGLAGLVYSMGLGAQLSPALSAGEVLQIFQTTADDIDVAESREPGSVYYWSQPGFDQRFGYGRVNANTAVESVKQGRIPPDVDIVKPLWFEVLYVDELTSPVEIHGTVSARRAPAYSYAVQWAPGVQPLDREFRSLTRMPNVKGTVVSGADGTPLATLDLREMDVTHPPDPDSPLGENRYTFTVRIQATAHYGGDIGDVAGELRRAFYKHSDPDLLPGFPIRLGASGESSPKLADIDGDGLRDIVVGTADGQLFVFSLASGSPKLVAGFPARVRRLRGLEPDEQPSYLEAPAYRNPNGIDPKLGGESISATPAIADMDGDGKPEIVVTTYDGTISIFQSDGTLRPGWPQRLPDVPSCPLGAPKTPPCMDTHTRITRGAFASPVLADLNADDKLDIVQAAFDGHVYVFGLDGKQLSGWPVLVHYPDGREDREYNRIMSTPAVADFTGDGIPDVLVGSNERVLKDTGAVYLIDGRGNARPGGPYLPNWPVTITSFNLFPLVSEGVGNSPIAGDFDGDGVPEAVFHGNASAPFILPTDPGKQQNLEAPPHLMPTRINPDTGQTERGIEATGIFGPGSAATRPDVMFPLFAQPSLGDLDQDGVVDVVASGGSQSMALTLAATGTSTQRGQHLLAMWSGKTGRMLPSSPIVIEDFTFFNNQAIADLTNDGYPEVLTGTGGYYVHAVDACGREPEGWPKFTGQWIVATTAVGDITGNGKLEVVVNSRNGWLYAWRTNGRADGVIAWESFHHDNRNTGHFETKLEQGRPRGDAPPLPVDEDGVCVIVAELEEDLELHSLEPVGGCACRAGPRNETPGSTLLATALLGLLARRRRGDPA
jgi:hypothetical protein